MGFKKTLKKKNQNTTILDENPTNAMIIRLKRDSGVDMANEPKPTAIEAKPVKIAVLELYINPNTKKRQKLDQVVQQFISEGKGAQLENTFSILYKENEVRKVQIEESKKGPSNDTPTQNRFKL